MTLLTFDHVLRKVFLKLWSAEVFFKHSYMSVLKLPLLVDLQQKSRRISSFHDLFFNHYLK
jgi:hypothetical protein